AERWSGLLMARRLRRNAMADFSGGLQRVNGMCARSVVWGLPKKPSPWSRIDSGLAFAAEFFKQLDLDLLNLEQPIVLHLQEVIDFFVQVPNLKLGFQIDFVIVFRAQAVPRFGPILTHHDNRRLHRRETGENQIEKDKWIRIERAGH